MRTDRHRSRRSSTAPAATTLKMRRSDDATNADRRSDPPTLHVTRGETALERYRVHLARSPLAHLTRVAYGRNVAAYLSWLKTEPGRSDALVSTTARDWSVRDWASHLRRSGLAPATVNVAVAAVDDLYRQLGLGPATRVPRERPPQAAPRALSDDQLRRLLRTIESRGRARDRAVVALMAFAGLRAGEVAALQVDDVTVTARTGRVAIREGKGGVGRQVPLPAEAREALTQWLAERPDRGPALFPSPDGRTLTSRAVHRTVAASSRAAGFPASPHTLRHTYVTRLVRRGVDLPLVAELAGHRSLDTTRRYALPTQADREAAVEILDIDY